MPPKPDSGERKGAITSFFAPASKPTISRSASQPTEVGAHHPATPHRVRDPSPFPSSPLSIRNTPSKPSSTNRNAVIAASDDEDDEDRSSDDDDLEDIMAKFDPRRNVPSAPEASSRPTYETPKAKRTMRTSASSSPIIFNPKPRFDMKALAEDALQDDATHASSLRNREAAEEASAAVSAAESTTTSPGDDPGYAILDVVQDRGGADAHKVRRAVQRASPGQSQLRYCFFSAKYTPPQPTPAPAIDGPWKLVTRGSVQAREQFLSSGLPRTLIDKTGPPPGALLEWILNDMCVQKSRIIQHEYKNLLGWSPEHSKEHLTPERLHGIFLSLGASQELMKSEKELPLSKPQEEPYTSRDWSCLRCFIELLGLVSKDMPVESVTFAVQTLLRMSMDRFLICTADVLLEYEYAMQNLLEALPAANWDSFCAETSKLLHTSFSVQFIRLNALLCLPVSTERLHQLRRRLAIAFLFDDPALAGRHPDSIVTIRGMIDRLGGEDFTVSAETNFDELRSGILLLNIAIDDGSFAPTDDVEDEKRFNNDIDELATKLREIWRRINDAGMKLTRTEAKSVIEWVQQRLTHSVRTKRKAKRSVFDNVGRAEDDPFLPQQRDYMRNFLGRSIGGT